VVLFQGPKQSLNKWLMVLIILWVIYSICFIGTLYFRYKIIFILEENGASVSKLAPYTILINKFSLMKNRGKINKFAPKKIDLFIRMAYISYYLATVILLVVFLSIIT